MDKAILYSLSTIIHETIESFLSTHSEDTNVHLLKLTYVPATDEADSYCELDLTATTHLIRKDAARMQETLDLEQPQMGVLNDPRLDRLEDLEAHITSTENNSQRGNPPLSEEARRARQQVADALLSRQK